MSTQQQAPRRPDASMTLLTEMLERPLDPGYAVAARRRVEAGLPPSRGQRSVLFTLTLVVVGFVVGVASTTLRGTATARSEARAVLIKQIDDARKARDTKADAVSALTAEIAARDEQVLAAQSSQQVVDLQRLSLATGAVAVRGPGLVVTVDDAPTTSMAGPNSDPRAGGRSQDGVVRARDLQIIANGLWAAGAEAVMINGQRLTATSAIRFAGEAIVVNYRPLVRPYRISAIGDPASLPSRFAEGAGGIYLATLKGSFGIVVDTSTADDLALPAATATQIRVAEPQDRVSPSASSSATATGGAP